LFTIFSFFQQENIVYRKHLESPIQDLEEQSKTKKSII